MTRVPDRSGAYHARLSEADGTHGQEQALARQQKGNKDQSESRHDGILSSFFDLILSYLSNAHPITMLSCVLFHFFIQIFKFENPIYFSQNCLILPKKRLL
jgi:hypothetical protein